MTTNTRRLAAEALEQWHAGHHYAESLIDHAARKHKLSREDRNLLNALVIGSIRNQRLLDHWIAQLRDGDIDLQVRCHLRVGLLQLYILGLPDHAAVNETVDSARKGIRGLINAVLRRAIREREPLLDSVEALPAPVRLSHPDWLVNRWTSQWGAEMTASLLDWNQKSSLTSFRSNPLKPEAQETLDASELAVSMPDHPGFYITKKGLPPRDWIEEGLIYIQDPATTHSVKLLAPSAGETVLDACAAPGGKATQIAAAMRNTGKLLCTDSNEKRLPRLQRNLERLGIEISSTAAFDWTQAPPSEWHQRFDAILLDVPCSNTGVMRKRIDARWRMTPENITQVAEIQSKILSNAAQCLKPGGRIVYSTCSIEHEENQEQISRFLAAYPNFELKQQQAIHPATHQTDGAYAALLVKAP